MKKQSWQPALPLIEERPRHRPTRLFVDGIGNPDEIARGTRGFCYAPGRASEWFPLHWPISVVSVMRLQNGDVGSIEIECEQTGEVLVCTRRYTPDQGPVDLVVTQSNLAPVHALVRGPAPHLTAPLFGSILRIGRWKP